MKKLISMLCALALCFGAFGAAENENQMNQKMTRVTQTVVDALDIGEEYSGFEGSYNDGCWYLRWSADGGELNVNCAEDGTVLSYYRYNESDYRYSSGEQLPVFPKYAPDALKTAADAFLAKVVVKTGWGWELDDFRSSLYRGGYSAAYAGGRLTFDGRKTDITISVAIDPMTGEVREYYRSDAYMKYNTPVQADVKYDEKQSRQAYEKLLAMYELELVYAVTDAKDMARLVYKRADNKRLALDFASGEVVDFAMNGSAYATSEAAYGMEADEAEDSGASMKRSLTETELKGIALYDDVLTASELDEKLRAMPELGITGEYELLSANYSISDGKPYANLEFRKDLGDDQFIYKSFRLDARTGRMLWCVSYSGIYSDKSYKDTDTVPWQGAAEAFIRTYYPEYAESIAFGSASVGSVLTADKPTVSYVFYRQHNGYAFRENAINVRINTDDGTVCGFNLNWNDGQEFYEYAEDSLISPDEARLAWLGESAFDVMYLSVPKADTRRATTYALTPCWCFDETGYVYAVDAQTAKRYGDDRSKETAYYEYPDSEDMLYADEIKTLGLYGIGLKDYGFTASDTLHNRQIMTLALQLNGYTAVENLSDEQLEKTFKNAFPAMDISIYQDLLHDKGTAALELVILAGYKDVALLQGIWHLDAADWDTVSEGFQGSLAIAYALGLYELEDGNINCMRWATTAEFMHGLYVLLSR